MFQPTLVGTSYRIFIEGLKSAVTKAAYTYALQKYMNHLGIKNPDDLLINQDNPKLVQNQIIEYLIQLKAPPHSLRYATRSQYLAAIMTFTVQKYYRDQAQKQEIELLIYKISQDVGY